MQKKAKKKAENLVRITPLGGLGEIGKNMTVVETRNDVIIIDCGFKFPDSNMPGVDFVIPDVQYLKNKKRNIRGIFVTHGHEDHKGAIPYLLTELGNPPIFATKLTLGLISVNLKEHNLLDSASLKVLRSRQEVSLGDFSIEPIAVTHSIPDAVAFAIRTPIGVIMFTGDFKIDHTPSDGRLTDTARLSEYGDDGILLMCSDSTNIETPGYTLSESVVTETVDRIFGKASGRILVASFASNLNRIQQIIDVAERYDRKVHISGRSMVNNVNIAMELGYLKVPKGILVQAGRLSSLPDHKIVIISTGSQGEAYSVLDRLAKGTNKQFRVKKGDTIVISASPIPGNEESVYGVIDDLFRLGAEVIYSKHLDVHVSGHACQEEQKLMLSLLRPRYFLPVHGEYRHLILHSRMAQEMGVKKDNIFVLENGHTLELTDNGFTVDRKNSARYVLVDGSGVGDIGNVVLKDRQVMSEGGIFIIVVNIKKGTAKMLSTPEILSRGFVYVKESQDLMKEAKQLVIDTLRNFQKARTKPDPIKIRGELKGKLKDLLFEKTEREPMVMPVVIEIE